VQRTCQQVDVACALWTARETSYGCQKNLTVMSSKTFSGGATNKMASVVAFPTIQDLY